MITEVNYETGEVHIQKFCGDSLQSKKYLVKLTEIYPSSTSMRPSGLTENIDEGEIPLLKSHDESSATNFQNESFDESSKVIGSRATQKIISNT